MIVLVIIDVSKITDVKKTSESNVCHICHYWYFLDKGFKFQPDACNGCLDLLIMSNLLMISNLAYLRTPFLVHYYFNIFICDLFMFLNKDDIANYADDNAPYSTGDRIHGIISDLEQDSDILSKLSFDNYLKANPEKNHVFLNKTSDTQNVSIASISYEKLLGIKIDQKLSFEPHFESLCKKVSQKSNALS